jgi:hypothetical protein
MKIASADPIQRHFTRSSALDRPWLQKCAALRVLTLVVLNFQSAHVLAQIQPVQPHRSAITEGHTLSNALEARSGLVRIRVSGPNNFGQNCTAAVLKSSQITDDTWLLTAAHCFYKIDGIDFGVHHAGSNLSISIEYGANLQHTLSAGSDFHIHPEWAAHVDGGFGIWYDHPDVAVIHFEAYVPVETEDGLEYVEFSRPFFSGVMKHYDGKDVGVFGARGEMRWARGQFEMSTKGYIVIDGSDWYTQDAVLEHGDSGGPWLYSTGEKSTEVRYVEDGVVMGVTSGGNLDISPTSWPPADFFAMGLSRPPQTDFILSTTNNAAQRVETMPWRRPPTLQYSSNGTGQWAKLLHTARNFGEVLIANFGPHSCDEGVPKDDVFLAEHGRWFVSWCGETDWQSINVSSTEIDDDYGLALGDFNGDGVTDVFRASGGEWKVSYSGTGPWTKINTSSTRLTDSHGLAFGDFNKDGVTDVFRASGGEWKVSYSGTGPWTKINSSSTELKDEKGLAFGDFDGDKITDVFRASGGEWKVSYSGSGPWTKINTSSTELTDKYGLAIGYFDKDKKSDVLRGNGVNWRVSYGGTGAWTTLNTSQTTTRRLAIGNLDGDKVSDVVLVRRELSCSSVLGNNVCPHFYTLYNSALPR